MHGARWSCGPTQVIGFPTVNSTPRRLPSCLTSWFRRPHCNTTTFSKLGSSSLSTPSSMALQSCCAWPPRPMAPGPNRYQCSRYPQSFFSILIFVTPAKRTQANHFFAVVAHYAHTKYARLAELQTSDDEIVFTFNCNTPGLDGLVSRDYMCTPCPSPPFLPRPEPAHITPHMHTCRTDVPQVVRVNATLVREQVAGMALE